MLDFSRVQNYYIACGYTDMRKQIDGLVAVVELQFGKKLEETSVFLFCGRRADRCKALLWRGNGFLLLYRRFEDGSMSWPRTPEEAAEITEEQFRMLMMGLNPLRPKIRDVSPTGVY